MFLSLYYILLNNTNIYIIHTCMIMTIPLRLIVDHCFLTVLSISRNYLPVPPSVFHSSPHPVLFPHHNNKILITCQYH